jgi:hypothetical protein
MTTNTNCCLPTCLNVTVNCRDCIIDTNCYINYDPLICNLRKIYKSYEERAKNVKYTFDTYEGCKIKTTAVCNVLPEFWKDYKIVLAGYSAYGGCPKKNLIKFYDTKKINDLFAENYVVTDSQGKKRIICEDICPFRLCQPHNVAGNSKYRLIIVFAYKYDICDTIYYDDEECKPWKYDLYVADLPSINCLYQDQCKIPQLQLQLVATLDSKDFDSVGDEEPACVLCVQPTPLQSNLCLNTTSSSLAGASGPTSEELLKQVELGALFLKYVF